MQHNEKFIVIQLGERNLESFRKSRLISPTYQCKPSYLVQSVQIVACWKNERLK